MANADHGNACWTIQNHYSVHADEAEVEWVEQRMHTL
jgi:hypothetical protein